MLQAIEAQEYPEVEIKGRTKVSSSITFQTLFKYYSKLSGMTVTRTALLLTPSLPKLLKLPDFMRAVMKSKEMLSRGAIVRHAWL